MAAPRRTRALEEVRRDMEATEAVRDEYGEDLIAQTFALQYAQSEAARLREALTKIANRADDGRRTASLPVIHRLARAALAGTE